MKGYLLEDIKKDFDELTKLNEERKNISICVKVNGVFRYNEKYLAHDKKIKDKIKEDYNMNFYDKDIMSCIMKIEIFKRLKYRIKLLDNDNNFQFKELKFAG